MIWREDERTINIYLRDQPEDFIIFRRDFMILCRVDIGDSTTSNYDGVGYSSIGYENN